MFKKSITTVFLIPLVFLSLQSCMSPATSMPNMWGNQANSSFPTSTTESHTKTTIVSPPSYNMVNLQPSLITQPGTIQHPAIYQQYPVHLMSLLF